MKILRVPLKLAGADAHEGQPVPVGLVHIGLDLEHKGGEVLAEHIHLPLVADTGQGRRGHAEELLQERLHAEGGEGGAEEHGGQGAVPHSLHVKLPSGPQQLHLLPEGGGLLCADHVLQRRVVQGHLGGADLLAPLLRLEEQDALLLPVVDALELLAGADGPVDGIGVDAQLLAQFQGVFGLPVHLVDEGEDGDVADGADPKQLPGLGLHTLGAVNDHDGGVRGHQGPVGVLGEILVARGVQDVDAEAAVLELQHGGRDGDAPLLLDLHPVRGGGAGPLSLDLARLGDGPAVQQELLCQRGLAGVRMGDDGEGPPPGNFSA